ncbi:hypothetical protein [Saccharopolyspora erythraea]|uniref:Uncharacterized protein n=2 Tax=Saccharopolyspora erythraea TaxID=1836 RepID=A4FJF4_SACEN|nr:hypothetical protein [Saccharopolyspora erythraea]QRK87983.1 hypothetical protein JQX30_24970 [Saccharopolyspora erythraea]CAM04179.1 hypothetical protein SACE_4913 [Saccharopolyspora erythraea NRRL 2338]
MVGAIGALGGVLIPLMFRASSGDALGSGSTAFAVFLVGCVGCAVITGVVYVPGVSASAGAAQSVARHSSTSEITHV